MTSKHIQQALWSHYGLKSLLMIPNYTPRDWFESDMIRVTKAGYMEEFEIKISVADFRADAKKGPDEREKQRMAAYPPERQAKLGFEFRSKHERLAAGDTRGPCRFWFAIPHELKTKVEIPSWAGMITFAPYGRSARIVSTYAPVQGDSDFKPAPKLHKGKADPQMLEHARSVFYYRYWNIRSGIEEKVES